VRIPAGVADGGRIRLAGQGPGGGDLILKIRIAPHPHFRVQGSDLETDLAVSPWEAALGAKVPVRTLEGEVTMTLPPGVQSGQRVRLRAKGLAKHPGPERGDLYAKVKILVPTALSRKERSLFESLAKASEFDPRA